jgi:hypothetical protein
MCVDLWTMENVANILIRFERRVNIYIIEFKLDKPASEAMEQIKGKDYAGKYALSGKRITLIGISFSSEKRTIVEELVESC